jgi:hypothetical protein
MKSFKEYINEMNVAGDGGSFGGGDSFGHGGSFGNQDFYAPGDSRVPHVFGMFKRAGGVGKKKKRAKLKNAIKRKSKGKRLGKRISRSS